MQSKERFFTLKCSSKIDIITNSLEDPFDKREIFYSKMSVQDRHYYQWSEDPFDHIIL